MHAPDCPHCLGPIPELLLQGTMQNKAWHAGTFSVLAQGTWLGTSRQPRRDFLEEMDSVGVPHPTSFTQTGHLMAYEARQMRSFGRRCSVLGPGNTGDKLSLTTGRDSLEPNCWLFRNNAEQLLNRPGGQTDKGPCRIRPSACLIQFLASHRGPPDASGSTQDNKILGFWCHSLIYSLIYHTSVSAFLQGAHSGVKGSFSPLALRTTL